MFAGFAWRMIRTALGLGIAQLFALLSNNAHLIWLAPVISAVAKVLRDKYRITNIPL